MEHKLKTWVPYFQDIVDYKKNFEVRKNDRDYKIGDILILREWQIVSQSYTRRKIKARVNYVLHGGDFGIEKDTVVMAIEPFKMEL